MIFPLCLDRVFEDLFDEFCDGVAGVGLEKEFFAIDVDVIDAYGLGVLGAFFEMDSPEIPPAAAYAVGDFNLRDAIDVEEQLPLILVNADEHRGMVLEIESVHRGPALCRVRLTVFRQFSSIHH